ncbi:MAG TPA: hypothetical protein DCL61_00920 [Cyanobacteria bacterium UBA12227]|nr:hypothetical protein [Cyanobacteria bacterium UBA12227]HBY78313.1 hypothetical protein [Cyanobacteria bacterium UBA11148]
MPSYFPTAPQPEPENKCPDCLSMKLDGIPGQPESLNYLGILPISQPQPIHLHLSIHFNEQWESLKQGRIKFGLKGGQLRLKLENAEIPYESRQLSGSVELTLETASQKSEESQEQTEGILATNSLFNPTKTLSGTNGFIEKSLGSSDKFELSVCHITTKVSEENPAWVFEEEKGQPILKGFLNKAKLATLYAIAFPCHVEATFEVSRRDVCLTDAEGLWPADISRNKRAVLDRLIIQRLLEPKFKPYLSRAELHYDG